MEFTEQEIKELRRELAKLSKAQAKWNHPDRAERINEIKESLKSIKE